MEEIKTKILLVEDDPNFGAVLKDYLSMSDYDVKLATDDEKGEDLFFKEEFNLCVLDVMMPKKDGFTLAAQIKRINPEMPVIFLTAKTLQDDVLEGFKVGADDYITKPFNSEELLYRIAAILKRGGKLRTNNQQKEFEIGKYHFNYKTRMLKNGGSDAKLSPKEAELLRLRLVAELSFLEISEVLGKSVNKIKKEYYKILKVISIEWKEQNGSK